MLQPITPQEGIEWYLESRENELADSTLQSHEYRLSPFITYCQNEGIDNLNDITARDISKYKTWRKNDGNLNSVSVKTQMDTIRVFMKYLESINGVKEDIHDKIISPTVGKKNQRDVMIESDRAKEILDYLSRYEYASLNHVLFSLLWSTGARLGTVRSFDIGDYDRDNQWLEAHHMPESDTPLKNKAEGERLISIKASMVQILDDYIEDIRYDVEDDFGRKPLLTTQHGRISRNFIRTTIYRLTCPEYVENGVSCNPSDPHKCDDCVSPHAIRRSSITYYLSNDAPIEIISDRCDVSRDVLSKHYDARSETVKVEQRRKYLANI